MAAMRIFFQFSVWRKLSNTPVKYKELGTQVGHKHTVMMRRQYYL
jgi:hypothetical protein